MAITGTLLMGVVSFFGVALEVRVKSQSIAEVDQQGAFIMDAITQTIRNASSVTAPAAAGNGATLTLVVPTGSLSPTVFGLSGSTLQVTEGAAAAVALSSNDVQISGLSFKNLTRSGTPGVIQVGFTVARVNTTGRNTYDYQKTFTSSAEVAW